MKKHNLLIIVGLVFVMGLGMIGCSNKKAEQKEDSSNSKDKVTLNISAAASLKEAMTELEDKFKEVEPDVKLEVNFGASGALQQQIEEGAPCDLFISAGETQMKALDKKDLLLDGTNKTLLTNDLVLITSKSNKIKNLDEIANKDVKHIAIGNPDSVPAGKYAKEVLDNTKLYDKTKDKLVLAKDVKEVLAWVEQGNADAGFVYLSDTVGVKDINISLTTKEDTHSPINYPVAVMKDSKNQDKAKAFEKFLLSDDGQAILEKYGFKKVK